MHFNALSLVASTLTPLLALATPILSPRADGAAGPAVGPRGSVSSGSSGGGGSVGGMSGGRGGGGFSGSSGRGGGGGYSGGRSGSSSGSSGFIGGVSVGHGHGSDSAATPDDCVVAKAVNKELKPSVDCFYSWEHWHWDNFLLYVIRITPTGQNSQGWTQGILDNIRGECGRGHVKYFFAEKRWHNSNEDFGEQRKINGTTFKGLEMTVPLGEWTAGEDETACVAEAIRKASCGVELNFTNGSCYRKPGTQLLPITLN